MRRPALTDFFAFFRPLFGTANDLAGIHLKKPVNVES